MNLYSLNYIKVNVLLQAYISQLKLEGFALMSDMVYVTQVCLKPVFHLANLFARTKKKAT